MPVTNRLFKKYSKKRAPDLLACLAPELIIELFLSLHSFGDLNALITTSAHCLRVFNGYTGCIINGLARNIVGPEAWHDNAVVLTCQRHHFPIADPTRLIRDLMTKFDFTRADIPHLASNERAYRVCAQQFRLASETVPSFLDIPFAFRAMDDDGGGGAGPVGVTLRSTPGFAGNGVLPRRVFYRVWVYCVATKFGNVGFPVEYLSCTQRVELRLVQYLMQPKSVRKAINYELMTGFKGRRPGALKALVVTVRPHAEKAWQRVLGMPRETRGQWKEFKLTGARHLWAFLENL